MIKLETKTKTGDEDENVKMQKKKNCCNNSARTCTTRFMKVSRDRDSLMDWVPISESSNMAARGWFLFLVLTASFYVCYGKKKVTKEVKKQIYIIISSQQRKSFKMLTYFGDEFESDAHLFKIKTPPYCCSIKLKMTSLPAN